MERTITAIISNSNDKKVFTSNANTLGELKAEMTAQGIDYNGMDFMEGLTHTQMIDDAAILPSNVQYKGRTTNNLVFMLSTTNKNIRSGAYTRQECYAKVKELNLQDAVKSTAGKNFTQVSTDVLNDIITKCEKKEEKKYEVPTDRKGLYEYIKANNLQETIKTKCGKNFTQCSTNALIEACKSDSKKSCKTSCNCKNITKEAPKTAVKNTLKKTKSPYSNEELDEIINGLKRK